MDTYSIQRRILSADLTPTEKLVGMALALHINAAAGIIRIRQATTAQECGLSASTVKRAIRGLIDAGMFASMRTGRAAILIPLDAQDGGKNSGIVERSPVTHQIGHGRTIRRKQRTMPWDLDTTLSTPAEERCKRAEAQEKRTAQRHARHSAPTDAPSPVVTSG